MKFIVDLAIDGEVTTEQMRAHIEHYVFSTDVEFEISSDPAVDPYHEIGPEDGITYSRFTVTSVKVTTVEEVPTDPFGDGREFTERRCWDELTPHEPHPWCDDDPGTDHWCNGKGRKNK